MGKMVNMWQGSWWDCANSAGDKTNRELRSRVSLDFNHHIVIPIDRIKATMYHSVIEMEILDEK